MKRLFATLLSVLYPAVLMAESMPYMDDTKARAIAGTVSLLVAIIGMFAGIAVVSILMIAMICGIMKLFSNLLVAVVGKDGEKYFNISSMFFTVLVLLFGHGTSKKRGRNRG